MKEYIDSEEVKRQLRMWIQEAEEDTAHDMADCFRDCIDLLDDVPAADVVEVRHGRWEPTMTSKTVSFYPAPGWKCSCCGHEIEDKSEKLHYPKQLKYCWNCGAKMEKQKEKPDDSD